MNKNSRDKGACIYSDSLYPTDQSYSGDLCIVGDSFGCDLRPKKRINSLSTAVSDGFDLL